MIPSKHKIISYTIGFGVGTLIACNIFLSKNNAKQERQAELEAYKPKRHILGADTKAHNPIDSSLSVNSKTYGPEDGETFNRVLILEGKGEFPFWRAEETIFNDPYTRSERLILRLIMAADRVVVRLDKEQGSLGKLYPILKAHKMRILEPGKKEGLYIVQLPTHDPDSLTDAIERLLEYKEIVAGAVPIYIKKDI